MAAIAPLMVALWIGNAAIAESHEPPLPLEQQVHEIADHLIGVMDTSAQAQVEANRVSVQMTTCEVTVLGVDSSNSVFLYQEQALLDRVDQPYRQRFLQITPGPTRAESRTYKPSDVEPWVGWCTLPRAERQVTVTDLGEQVCEIALRPSVLGYVGSTSLAGCPTTVRGAVRITNVVVLHDQGMDTWDRGFDRDGNRVWGAEDEPYRYRWSTEGEP